MDANENLRLQQAETPAFQDGNDDELTNAQVDPGASQAAGAAGSSAQSRAGSHEGSRPTANFMNHEDDGQHEGGENNPNDDENPYNNDSFNNGRRQSPRASAHALGAPAQQPNQGSPTHLNPTYLQQHARAPGGAEGPASPNQAVGKFHWTMLMPPLYTFLLLFMSCISGYFTLSGAAYFILFIMHSFAYYGFRAAYDPIDMLSSARESNKSHALRVVFKWSLVAVSAAYLLTNIIGRITFEYTEVKTMMQDEDHERLRKDQINLERSLNKIIPDFFSYWTIAYGIIMVGAACGLIKIQQIEEEWAEQVDQSCLDLYRDVHYSSHNPLGSQLVANAVGQLQSGQPLTVNNQPSAFATMLLNFKPYQVQKCVLIFKDYKFKTEIFVCFQILLLVLICNAQYCVYGLAYLTLSLIQILNIAMSHGRSDQNIRKGSSILTLILIIYVPLDLLLHYFVHFAQESQRIDDEYDSRYFEQPQTFQLQGYHGIMATTPSYSTFGLKIALLIFECMKYKYSYDMAPVYDKLKTAYLQAESSSLPESKLMNKGVQFSDTVHKLVEQKQANQGDKDDSKEDIKSNKESLKGDISPALQVVRSSSFDMKRPKDDETEEAKEPESQLARLNQQNTMDFQRRQRYNKLLKLQYIRIFRKSSSFVHKILQPISLFMLCVIQLIFVLSHPSVLFIVLFALVISGFFVVLKDHDSQSSFFLRAKIILCIEAAYVLAEYVISSFQLETHIEYEHKEEWTILLGLGSEQQLGYYEDEVNLYDNLFPFNYSILFLLLIAVFTRYMGKPSLAVKKATGEASGSKSGAGAGGAKWKALRDRMTDNSSERRHPRSAHGPGDDDMLTVLNDGMGDDNMSFSDVRSQRSRRGFRDNQSQNQSAGKNLIDIDARSIDLYHNIIEEEDENDLDDEDGAESQAMEARSGTMPARMQNHMPMKTMPRIKQHQSAFEFQNKLGANKTQRKIERADPSRDSTTRGKIRRWFNKAYLGLLAFIDKIIDISIVHINKFVLLALFLVSVSRPTVINVLLFIMFLILSMVNHHNEYRYLRLTLLINSLAIGVLYLFDVFIQRDFSAIRTWVLYLIGVQYRSENVSHHIVKLKYLPYIFLQIILCLSVYVFQSDKYKYFKSQYLDIESQKKMQMVKQMTKRHQASETPLSKHAKSRQALSRKSKSNLDVSMSDARVKSKGSIKDDVSKHSSFQKEGGDDDDPVGENNKQMEAVEADPLRDPEQIQDMDSKSLIQKDEMDDPGNDQIDDKMTIPDETKTNLIKQQEMIVMYDPVSKFVIKNAAYFLIFFMFIEVLLLPLSIMNIILLVLMTIIVVKMLFCETRIETYRSLANVLHVLNIFAIIYIFTKYMFLFTEYTQNIQLKNSIENGYHAQGLNEDGTVKHGDLDQEQRKTEDARQQLQHSHDHDDENRGRSFGNKLLEKMFGFVQAEDEKNEAGTLLSFKLLNLAIVLSLTNLQLNILRHRNLPFLLGEKDEVLKSERARRNETERAAGHDEGYLGREERAEKIQSHKLLMNKKIERWLKTWRWWHYTKMYFAFILWLLLPVSIIISAFYFYPLSTISVPSVAMILVMLILLATNANPDCWRTIYKSIGTLLQVMITVCYILYFSLLDQMQTYDLNDATERQQYQNMKVLWGLYQSGIIIQSEQNGKADDVASILSAIIPLFVILCLCFVQKEIDKWFNKNFNVSIHVDPKIKREVLRHQLREDREFRKLKRTMKEQLKAEAESRDGEQSVASNQLDGQSAQQVDNLSGGTLGVAHKDEEDHEVEDKQGKFFDDEGKEICLEEGGDLAAKVLESMGTMDNETAAQCRGDQEFEKGLTNQFLIEMIQEVKAAEAKLKSGQGLVEPDKSVDLMSDQSFTTGAKKAMAQQRAAQDEESKTNPKEVQMDSLSINQTPSAQGMTKQSDQGEKNEDLSQAQTSRAIKTVAVTKEDIERYNIEKRVLEEYLISIINYENPIRQCYFFKNEICLRYIAINNSLNLLIYFGLYAILNKMNLLALFYWICLYRIIKKNFKPNIFKNDADVGANPGNASHYNLKAQYGSAKNKQILSLIHIQLVAISAVIIIQLSFSIYTNIQFAHQEDLQKGISNTFCPNPQRYVDDEDNYDEEGNVYQTSQSSNPSNQLNKECAQDWSYYLLSMAASSQSDEESQRNIQENQDFVNASVFLDLIFLLLTYLFMFVVSGQMRLTKGQLLDHPNINDANDFVSTEETSRAQQRIKGQTWKFIQMSLFVYFPYFLIVYLMYTSSSFNGQAISDLLSSIYLWYALKYIINAKKLFSKNTKILSSLRTYNRIVLFLILIYQMPLFLCPSAVDINGYTDPDYINTEDCSLIMHYQSNNQSKKYYEAKQPMQLYIILSHSIGLLKQNSVNMTFLFLFFFTEVQHQIFQHPHFKEYVVKHKILEKESDGKVRAFMFVERFHLTRLWSYKAIKEEIKILHKILLRLNDQISKSDFAKNLAGFAEYQQKHGPSGDSTKSQAGADDENKALLENAEKDKEEDKDKKSSDAKSEVSDQLTKEVEEFIELNSQTIDGIALANLRADKPVIPLKIIIVELKTRLQRDLATQEIESLREFDEEALTKYVDELIASLSSYVYTKNRIDLYHEEGVGLSIALDENELDTEHCGGLHPQEYSADGCSKTSKTLSAEAYLRSQNQKTFDRQNLYKKLFKSYDDAQMRQRERVLAQGKSLESGKSGSSEAEEQVKHEEENKEGGSQDKEENGRRSNKDASSKGSPSSADPSNNSSSKLEQDFNPSPASFDIDEATEEETLKDMTWPSKINYHIRLYLWMNYIDHILFIHLEKTKDDNYKLKRPQLQEYGILRLLEASLLSRSYGLVIMAVVFNFIMNANLISLFIMLMVFGVQILENPLPSTRFWKFIMSYVLTIISLKFLYQLPIFCGTPVYTFYSDRCNNEDLIPQVLASRIDYVIGIHKFSGPASYPRNVGIFNGIIADILLLMILLLHKQYLSKIGAWNYVKNNDNIYKNPSFQLDSKKVDNEDTDMRTRNERADLLTEMHHQVFVYEQSAWYEKAWYNTKRFFYRISNFYGKVLPQYMHRRQKNIDSRKRSEHPYITHKFQKVKPGQDFFTQIFFVLMVVDIYTLIYWKNISGEDKSQSFGAATVSLDRFSTPQVISLFLILMLLLFERMLYRARYVDDRDHEGKFQSEPTIGNSTHVNQAPQYRVLQRTRNAKGSRHTLTIKLCIYYCLIILIHVYLGFIIPQYQLAPMRQNPWLVIFYLLWCFYFYYSALQIKNGFPMAPYKQAFSKDTSSITYLAWKTYKAIPFIWEMKVIIDWTITSTCLDLFQWFKLDDAYNTLYYNSVQADQRKSRPEFKQRDASEKILQGFCFALGLIFIILAPIFLFSGINPIMVKNAIKSGTLTIDLELIATGNSYRIFETKASRIDSLTKADDISWRLYFEPQSNQIDYQDMQKLQFTSYSESQWSISPPSLKRFINDFKNAAKDKATDADMINFKSSWTFNRDNPTGKEKPEGKKVVALSKKECMPLIKMLEKDNNMPQQALGPPMTKLAQIDSSFAQLKDDVDIKLQLMSEYQPINLAQSWLSQPPSSLVPSNATAQLSLLHLPLLENSPWTHDSEGLLPNTSAGQIDHLNTTSKIQAELSTSQLEKDGNLDDDEAEPRSSSPSPQTRSNNTNAASATNKTTDQKEGADEFEYREEYDDQADNEPASVRYRTKIKTMVAVKDAFPKIIHLNAQAEAKPLAMQELQANSSQSTSMELQLHRQGSQMYYWTFSLGTPDGRGGKNRTAYLRDTPGVFNSRNTQEDIEAENKAEKRKQSTSKVDKKLRERDKFEMSKKKVKEEQNLVMLIYSEEVVGSFFGNALQLSVVGLYATIVIAIGRFLRIVFDRISQRVMYEELPSTKQLFEITEGIFIAQLEGDLVREKQLYDLLILMYRSPEALIKITGTRLNHKEESVAATSSHHESDFDSATIVGSSSSLRAQRRLKRQAPLQPSNAGKNPKSAKEMGDGSEQPSKKED